MYLISNDGSDYLRDFLKNKSKTIEFIISILIIYLGIKLINNYSYFINILKNLYNILLPFVFAFIFAYILNPIMKVFEKKCKLNRKISIAITYVLIILIFILIGISIFPKIYSNLVDLSQYVPQFVSDIKEWATSMLSKSNLSSQIASDMNIDTAIILDKVKNIVTTGLNAMVSNTINFTSSFIKILLGFLISIYVLYDKEKFINVGKKSILLIFRQKWGRRIIDFIKNINRFIGEYIGIKALDSLIIGILAFIGLTIIKCKYSIIVAIVVGITNMIPYFGPFIGMLTGFLINVFFSPFIAFIVFIFLFLLQQFDAWYLDPKLVGNRVGLSPYFVILAVTVGGGLYGPIGMILAVPVMAVIKIYWLKIPNKIDLLYKRVFNRKGPSN